MISLRYHIVSIAAVFLALALGVVLGSTSLSSRLLSTVGGQRETLQEQVTHLEGERADLRTRLSAADRFGEAVGPLAVQGRLNQRSVVLISSWDAAPQQRDAVRDLLRASG